MTTMIEKVARAICASVPGTGDVEEHFSDEFPLARRHWMEMARAAVEAMREPSEKILAAGLIVFGELDGVCSSEFVLNEVHKAMFNAALKETTP